MKLHTFQKVLLQKSLEIPKTRYTLHGNVARFYYSQYQSPREAHSEMEDIVKKGYDVHLYDENGQEIIMGSKFHGKNAPWRKKLSRGYGYFATIDAALRA